MAVDPDSKLFEEFDTKLRAAVDEVIEEFDPKFQKLDSGADIAAYQVMCEWLGESEGFLVMDDIESSWIRDTRQVAMAKGLDLSIAYHAENCDRKGACGTMDRLKRARSRFDKVISDIDERMNQAEQLTERMLACFAPQERHELP